MNIRNASMNDIIAMCNDVNRHAECMAIYDDIVDVVEKEIVRWTDDRYRGTMESLYILWSAAVGIPDRFNENHDADPRSSRLRKYTKVMMAMKAAGDAMRKMNAEIAKLRC